MSPAARFRWLAFGGGLAMFLVQPPADLWWAAWLAPLPWLMIVRGGPLPVRRPWLTLWCAGFVHWLLAIHWLRLPHPATAIGWVALSAYLALYVPLFIWLARRLGERFRWPLVPAAAVAWMACEQARGWVLGGFTFAGLGHTQWRWTTLLQAADAVGAVGVSGLVMAGAAAIAALLPGPSGAARRRPFREPAFGAAVLLTAVGYGQWRLATAPAPAGPAFDALLVQGSIDTELKHDPDAAADVVRHYDEITMTGLKLWPTGARPDLVVWPETMWRWSLLEIDPAREIDDAVVTQWLGPAPADAAPAVRAERQARTRQAIEKQPRQALAAYARRYGTTWLVGIDKQQVTPRAAAGQFHFNCGLFLDAAGTDRGCYAKMHPVMFGEYVPLADRFPWLYRLTPLPAGLTAGREPVAVEIAGRSVAVNICYETALPEGVRSAVRRLAAGGRRPAVLVNLTNDGWFWGSSELDMHLAAAIFRAVEIRTPILVAANTGFSAVIDGSGRLLERGPRRATAALRARVWPDGRPSPWLGLGSLPTGACVAVALAVMVESGLWRRPTGGLERRDKPE